MKPFATDERRHLQGDQFLAALVSSSDDAIIGKTLGGVVVFWNAAAERLYGYSAAEMVGRNIAVLFPLWMLDEYDNLLARARGGETVHDLCTERLHKDGRRIEMSVTISPVIDSDGAVVGVASVARDLTENNRIAGELARLTRDAAESLSLLKTLLESAPVGFGFDPQVVDACLRLFRESQFAVGDGQPWKPRLLPGEVPVPSGGPRHPAT
ncbi:MAG TPA: PAS domain S-box protein [Acidimicrobiales bacterium]